MKVIHLEGRAFRFQFILEVLFLASSFSCTAAWTTVARRSNKHLVLRKMTRNENDVPTDVLSLEAHEISDLLQSSQLTSVQLMEATLERIEQVNPIYNAIILLQNRTLLLQQAQRADEERCSTKNHTRGWLHGIPMAIKDLSQVQGFATTHGGSPLICQKHGKDDSYIAADQSDVFVERLVESGAIIIGKTNAPEHGLGSHTYNNVWGVTRNPFDRNCTAGGSSGGAAVALSTHMVCLADGSDMMGSLRNPAGFNHIYSHRPTAGMIANGENPYLPYPISTVGPMARCPRDLALLLETMAGSNAFSASLVQYSLQEEILQPGDTNMSRIKLAWLGDWGGAYHMEKGILEVCYKALQVLEKQKLATLTDLRDSPPFDASLLWQSWTTIRSKLILSSFVDSFGAQVVNNMSLKPAAKWEIQRGLEVTDAQLREATAIAQNWSKCVASLLEKYDALVLPTSQLWPFPVELDWPKSIDEIEMDTYHRWMEVVVPCSLAGLPCVTVPAGFGPQGLPMGLQLIGARGNDARLLSIAHAYHSKTQETTRRPPIGC